MSAQQTGFTIQLRRRSYQPSCSCPVERGAARAARHVRERLLEVIPGYQPGVITRFYLMRSARPRMRASGTRPPLKSGGSVLFKAGAKWLRDASNPPAGLGPKPQGHSGERPAGSLDTDGVGSFPVVTPRNRRLTTFGVLPQKQTVKSSTMRGAQALASKPQQRRSQIGKRLARADRSSLLYSNDRNQRVVARWKLCRSGSFGHAWQARTHRRPTNVNAVSEEQE